jgi:tetratricopeptide (TPR) repeat protein
LESYYGLLTCMNGPSADRGVQLQTCMRAVEAFPLDAQLLCALGGYLQAMGHYELAGRAYDVAAGHGQIESEIWHLPDIREIAATCRAIVLQLQGNDIAARASLIEARKSFPQSLRLARQLVELLAKEGNQDEAMAVLDDLPRETPQLDALRSAVRGVCLAVHGKWIAAKAYLDTAYRAGCRERLCLRWMVVSCLALQQRDEAREALAAWELVDPANAEIAQFRAALGAEQVQPMREAAPVAPAPTVPSSQIPSRAGSLRLDVVGRDTAAPGLKPHAPANVPRSYEAPTSR